MSLTKIPGTLIDSTSNFTFANVVVNGNITSGHILPSANLTYDLGSPTSRFRSLYVGGNTIDIGGATISTTANGISLTSPTGAVFSVSGSSAADTVGSFGSLTVTGNVASGSFYSNNYFYANGSVIKSGGTSTSSSNAPTSPGIGDIWYNTTTDVVYRYTNDGVSSYWIDITGPTYGASFVPVGGSAATYAEATGNITLAVNTKYLVNTSAARTLTLPATPALGQAIGIIDGTGTCATYNITINRNSSNIQGLAEDLTINSNRAAFTLVYYNVANGWVLTNV